MQHKNIRELLENESFLNYCLERNPRDMTYWEQWLAANPQQREEVRELKTMVLLLGNQLSQKEASNQFAKLETKISGRTSSWYLMPYNFFSKIAVAALVLAALGIGFYALNNDKSANKKPLKITAVNDVAPGGDKATLTLANGRKINLHAIANGSVLSESGVKIVKKADGQLVYDLSEAKAGAGDGGFNTIEVPAGGQWQVILPDQSKVWLNAKSSISYPTKFVGQERKVKIRGEAYFEVSHRKSMPFRVETGQQVVEVLGTSFNISAYPDDEAIKTTLFQGSVKLCYAQMTQLLKPGQQGRLKDRKIDLAAHVNLEEILAWKNGEFQFDDHLHSIMNKIARWYDVEVIYETKRSTDLMLSGKISRSRNLSAILKMLEFSGDVHFKVEGRRITVTD